MSPIAPDPILDPPECERFEVHAWIGCRLRLFEGKGATLEEAIRNLLQRNGYAEFGD
ncbi:hypothetical protein [Burkholderia stagnalis]|uniref:hypothetical protein n=1 Tax=Burkholderia stagnalis TaxID=1503054 RepID=UPI0016233866|nr:hypothetical protein [Burkholderia stagnalis]